MAYSKVGYAYDRENGQPLKSVQVVTKNADTGAVVGSTVTTNTVGKFTVPSLDSGTAYKFEIRSRTLLTQYSEANVARLNAAQTWTAQQTFEGQTLFPSQGVANGIVIGTDAQWYRDEANELRTPDSVRVDDRLAVGGTLSANFGLRVSNALVASAANRQVVRVDGSVNQNTVTNTVILINLIPTATLDGIAGNGIFGVTINPALVLANGATAVAATALNLSASTNAAATVRGALVGNQAGLNTVTTTTVAIEVAAQTAVASVVNAYGLLVNNISGATNNYAIYTNAGAVSLGGALTVRAGGITVTTGGITATGSLDVTGGTFLRGIVDLGIDQANYIEIVGQAAGSNPAIYALGANTNINLILVPKGVGDVLSEGGIRWKADPVATAGYIGLGITTGVGNGAGTNLTAPAKGTGSGPASLVVNTWVRMTNGTQAGWVPFFV